MIKGSAGICWRPAQQIPTDLYDPQNKWHPCKATGDSGKIAGKSKKVKANLHETMTSEKKGAWGRHINACETVGLKLQQRTATSWIGDDLLVLRDKAQRGSSASGPQGANIGG